MSMFKIDELSGSLIKSGRFADAIPKFGHELQLAMRNGVLAQYEIFASDGIIARFNRILLNPSDMKAVQQLGDDMIYIAIRIPDYVKRV